MDTTERFSDLLWMPNIHKKYQKLGECGHPINLHLGVTLCFYHIAKVKKNNVDKYLISALVERWSPEGNNMSCLWGLPICGKPLIGKAGAYWYALIERSLGNPVDEQHMKQKKRKKINWRARAIVLEILGCMVFINTSRDGVPAMYLQFMQNIWRQTKYNWGATALAMLDRELSMGAEKARLQVVGPLLLPQLCSWSHFPLGRPKKPWIITQFLEQSEEEHEQHDDEEYLYYSPIFGAKWCAPHEFDVPHNASTQYYCNQIDLIQEGLVQWKLYDDILNEMPVQVLDDAD
ncbi:hypothetical protein ZWY2020_020952 [Hordeum vulgare]|nr:hypothetical protein ZWY2020_020952 [Hordeum vulgare]